MELLNPNIVFSAYRNNKLHNVTAQSLFSNRRVLICSVVRPRENLDHLYINHLIETIPYYKKHGIDDVYIVNSSSGRIVLARWEKNHPGIVGLYDNNADFVKELMVKIGKRQDLDTLSKYWSYQVLLNNGVVEKFYEQPTDNYIKNIIESGYKLHLGNHKFFALAGNDISLHRPSLRQEEQNFEMVNIEEKLLVTGAVLYYNLWPNYPLHNYLKSV
jgi:peroxiredoxin